MSDFLFGSEFRHLETALSARERLQSVRATNIANADTPHYKADARTFEDVFHSMVESDAKGAVARTDPRHMDVSGGGRSLEVFSRRAASERMDGNSVDIQNEMEKLAENQLMHEYTLRIIQGRLHGLQSAIKEGGR